MICDLTCRLCKSSRFMKNHRCPVQGDSITPETPACPDFVFDGTFYCPIAKRFTHIASCVKSVPVARVSSAGCSRSCPYYVSGKYLTYIINQERIVCYEVSDKELPVG